MVCTLSWYTLEWSGFFVGVLTSGSGAVHLVLTGVLVLFSLLPTTKDLTPIPFSINVSLSNDFVDRFKNYKLEETLNGFDLGSSFRI